MIELGILIQLLVTVAEVLKEVWEGPLGELIRDIIDGKPSASGQESMKELEKVIDEKSEVKVTVRQLAKVVYLFTVARVVEPKKFRAAQQIKKMVIARQTLQK